MPILACSREIRDGVGVSRGTDSWEPLVLRKIIPRTVRKRKHVGLSFFSCIFCSSFTNPAHKKFFFVFNGEECGARTRYIPPILRSWSKYKASKRNQTNEVGVNTIQP